MVRNSLPVFWSAPKLFTMPGAAFQWMEWLYLVLGAGILWHQCESIVKLIFDIPSFQVFEQPVQ